MAEAQRITYLDFYKSYPYKCQDIYRGNSVVIPYVPLDDQNCDEGFPMSYKEFKSILSTYLDLACLSMFQGYAFNLGARLGYIKIGKTKSRTTIDWEEFHKTGEFKPHKRMRHLKDYKPVVDWYKTTFKYKTLWSVRITKAQYRKLLKRLHKNPNNILKLG